MKILQWILVVAVMIAIHVANVSLEGQVVATREKSISAQLKLVLSGNRANDIYYKGEPIRVRVIFNSASQNDENIEIGTDKEPWYSNVKLYIFKGADSSNNTATQNISGNIEADTKPVNDQMVQVIPKTKSEINIYPNQPQNNILKPNENATSYWYIAPELTKRLDSGNYNIKATWTGHLGNKQDTLNSGIISIVIDDLKSDKGKGDICILQGDHAFDLGNYNDAITHYCEAAKYDPNNKEILCMLGRAYECSGNIENAIIEYKKYITLAKALKSSAGNQDDNEIQRAKMIEKMVLQLEEKLKQKNNTKEHN